MWKGFLQAVQRWRAATPKWLRITVVAVTGTTVLLFGIVLTVLPGPAVIVIPIGLAILATEFVWAQRCLQKLSTITGKLHLKRFFTKEFWRKPPRSRAET